MRSPRFGDSDRAPATTRSAGCRRGGGLDRLLKVDEGEAALAVLLDAHERGVAEEAKRGAALHPVGRVDEADAGLLATPVQGKDQAAHRVPPEELVEGAALRFVERPELAAERDPGLDVLQPLAGEVLPLPAERPSPDGADHVEPLRVAADHLLQHPGGDDAG
jgi:hypothetical protein